VTNPKISVLCDNFDQGSINSVLWTSVTIPSTYPLGLISTATLPVTFSAGLPVNQTIDVSSSMTFPAVTYASGGGGYGVESVIPYDLTDSGLSVEVTNYTSGNYFNFQLAPSGAEYIGWAIDNSGNVNALSTTGPSANAFSHHVPLPLFLRIREDSGTVYWDYSFDGVNWTNALSISDPFALTSLYVDIDVIGLGSAVEGSTSFSHVNYVL
jgi:hypothetical protein